jgi:uridine kinase
VLRACRDDLTLVVFVDEDREERIMRLVLRC